MPCLIFHSLNFTSTEGEEVRAGPLFELPCGQFSATAPYEMNVTASRAPNISFHKCLLCMCNAPHVSSGHERSAVATVVFPFKLPRGFIPQG